MTEAGQKWMKSLEGVASSLGIPESQFWIMTGIVLRAFCDELEKRNKEAIKTGAYSKQYALSYMYGELKRELLGTEVKFERRKNAIC